MATSRTNYQGRISRLASSSPKDFEFENFIYQDESPYPHWWSAKRLWRWFRTIPDNTFWNSLICFLVMTGLVAIMVDIKEVSAVMWIFDVTYNVLYGLHILAMIYDYQQSEFINKTARKKVALMIDFLTYLHYLTELIFNWSSLVFLLTAACYFARLHRPIQYLWTLNEGNMKGSIMGTALKYLYLFAVARTSFTFSYMVYEWACGKTPLIFEEGLKQQKLSLGQGSIDWSIGETGLLNTRAGRFFYYFFIIDKIFFPIGPNKYPLNNVEQVMTIMMTVGGCLMMSGAAVASLALVIALYMRPEESFRSRFKLIMDEMVTTKMPGELLHKVETFYRMYWVKQKAVSVTALLPIFPPTLPASIYTDIYCEAQQKCLILRDLSYQFLWEISKVMSTIHYIPGDAIIKRNSNKSDIIFISYGDIEMLTAEDDDTPLLRMTRGSIISGTGGCVALACAKSYVRIRAATFCIAHVLPASDMWRVAAKYGKLNGQTFLMLSAFEEHLARVKKHYNLREKTPVKYKSSILQFKRNILALKKAIDPDGNKVLERDDYFLLVAGSYIMRNAVDTTLAEESDEICLRPTFPCIFQPESSLLYAWHGFVSILIFVVCIVHPYHIVFLGERSLTFIFFDYVVTLVYIVDLLVILSVGDNVEEGEPITFVRTSSKQISRNPWFLVDVIATLPIFNFIGTGRFSSMNKLARVPKVFKMLKALEEVSVYHSNIFRFMSYAVLLFLTCYFVGTVQQGVMCFIDSKCIMNNLTHNPHWVEGEMDVAHVEERVAYRFYVAISMVSFTSDKSPDIEFLSLRDMVVTVILLEVCCVMYIFIEAVYSATIMVNTAMRDEYDACIGNVKKFLVSNNVDPVLCQRFIGYLQLCWYTDKAYAITHHKRKILFDLPPHVYQDIMAMQRNKYLLVLPFMNLVNASELKEISARMTLFYTSPNEILLNTADIINEIYIIKRGYCEVFDPDTRQSYGLLGEKGYFGLLECLLRCPAYYTVRAVTHVQIFSISRKTLMKLLAVPKMNESVKYAKDRPEFKSISIRRDPFMEYVAPPTPKNRQKFPVPRKHIPDTAFLYPFTRLGVFSLLRYGVGLKRFRYVFPRFTIRPDGKYMMRYELFRGVCALCSAMIFPSYTYMVLQFPWLFYWVRLLDTAGYYDLIQRMLVGYYNQDGILVYHPASTAAHYLRGAFVTDLFACLPLELLEIPHREQHDLGRAEKYMSLEIQQFLMLNRIVQLYRIASALEFLSYYIQRHDVILVLKAIPLIMVTLNVVTCLVVVHSVDIYEPSVLQGEPWRIVMNDDKGGSWLYHFREVLRFNSTESPGNLQLTCAFWVVYEVITTGFNVFKPSSLDLVYVICIGMFVGETIVTYFSVLIISMRSNVNKVLAKYQQNMKDIITYMKREKLGSEITKEVRDYYEYNWNKMGGLDYREVLKLCDQITLRTDAILHIYGHTFAKCPILYHCDMSLLRVLGRAVYSLYFLEDTVLIEIDDVISDLYIIDYGNIEVTNLKGAYTSTVKLPKGSVFGNLDAQRTYRCTSRVVATSNAHLLQINSLTFHTIIADFPTVKVLMKKYRPKNENYIIGNETYESGMAALLKEKSGSRMSRISIPLISITKSTKWINYVSSNGLLTQLYLIGISLTVTYADVYNAGFAENSRTMITTLYSLDCMFYVKILVYLAMPIVVTADVRPRYHLIRRKYLKREFRFDILSCLPFELISFIAARDDPWQLFAVLRLNRMFRMITVYECLQRHTEQLSVNLVWTTMLSVFIWFSVFVHSTTCIWYAIGKYEDLKEPGTSWMHFRINDDKSDSEKITCASSYVCAMYYVLTTFTHNSCSDILPQKRHEVMFTIWLEIMSSLIFMIYVGEFSNIIQYQSFRYFLFYSQFLQLQEFLKNNRVSKNLVKLVNRYSLHLWRESRGLQLPHFLETAPQCLRLKLMSAAYIRHLETHPYFRFCETTFLRQLVGCLRMYTYCEGVYVVKENEITDAMYLIHQGRIAEIDEEMDDERKVYKAGQNFGSANGLVRNSPFPYSYRAIMDSQVLTLQLDFWEYLLNHFPRSRYQIYKNIPGHMYGKRPGQSRQLPISLEKELESVPFSRRRSTLHGSTLGEASNQSIRRSHRHSEDLKGNEPSTSGLDLFMDSAMSVPRSEQSLGLSINSQGSFSDQMLGDEILDVSCIDNEANAQKFKKSKEEQSVKPRLSFLPQLVQTDEEVRAEQRAPRRSILTGLTDRSKITIHSDSEVSEIPVLPKFIANEDSSQTKSRTDNYRDNSFTFYDGNESTDTVSSINEPSESQGQSSIKAIDEVEQKLTADKNLEYISGIVDDIATVSETKIDIESKSVTPIIDKAPNDFQNIENNEFIRERKSEVHKTRKDSNVVDGSPENIQDKNEIRTGSVLEGETTEESKEKETTSIHSAENIETADSMLYESGSIVDETPKNDSRTEKDVFINERKKSLTSIDTNIMENVDDEEHEDRQDKYEYSPKRRRTVANVFESGTTEESKDKETTSNQIADTIPAAESMLYESGTDFHTESNIVIPIIGDTPKIDPGIEKDLERKKTLSSILGSETQLICKDSDLPENVIVDKPVHVKDIKAETSKLSVISTKLSSGGSVIREITKVESPHNEIYIPKSDNVTENVVDVIDSNEPSTSKKFSQTSVVHKKLLPDLASEPATSRISPTEPEPKHRKSLFFDINEDLIKTSDKPPEDIEDEEDEDFKDFEKSDSLDSVDEFLEATTKKKKKKRSDANKPEPSTHSLTPGGPRRGRRITHVRIDETRGDDDDEGSTNDQQIISQFPIVRPLHSPQSQRKQDSTKDQSDPKQPK